MRNRNIIKILRVSLVLLALLGISFSIAVLLDYSKVVNYYDLLDYGSIATVIAIWSVVRIIYLAFLTYDLITRKTIMVNNAIFGIMLSAMTIIESSLNKTHQFGLFVPKLIIEILFEILLLVLVLMIRANSYTYLIKRKKKKEDEYE